MKQDDDPVAQLGKDLAADHTLEKARGAGEQQPNEAEQPAEAEELEDDEAQFIGDFDSFDAVRAFAESADTELETGDLAVVNGALVRFEAGAFKTVVSSLVDEYALPVDHTEAFSRSVANLERIVLEADFESGPLLGGLRDTVLGMFKARPKGWTEMSQLEQRELAKQVEAQCKTLLRKVARVVAEGEEISVAGKLEAFSCKGAFDLKISAPGDEDAAVMLYRMVGHDVVIRSVDAESLISDAGEAKTDPDQPELFADAPSAEEMGELAEKVGKLAPDDDSDLAEAGEFEDDVDEAQGGLESGDAGETSPVDAAPSENEAAEPDEDDGVGEYERRQGPDDEPVDEVPTAQAETDAEISARLTAGFDEASEEELAGQAGRAGAKPAGDGEAAADYTGPREPEDAVPGETWVDTSKDDKRPRHKHPNGKWYLSAPTAEALEEWRAANKPADPPPSDGDFPADPD